jgi:hypothetical protein
MPYIQTLVERNANLHSAINIYHRALDQRLSTTEEFHDLNRGNIE